MSDKMRWCYGDTNPVVAAVDSATVIEIGDCVSQCFGTSRPAKDAGDDFHDCLASQLAASFKAHFLGVAMQRSQAGDTCPIRVATTGVFEFDCYTNTFILGDLVAMELSSDLPGSSDARLANQRVAKTNDSFKAIGRVAKREPTDTNEVLVDIRSTVMTGGV